MRLLIWLLIPGVSLYAQVNALLVGAVRDSLTGKPVGEILYRIYTTTQPPKLVVKGTVKQDGTFQALLRSGATYQIFFTHYTILQKRDTLHIPPLESFEEIPRTFTVLQLQPDMLLGTMNVFEPGSATLSTEGEQALTRLLQLLRYNRQLFLKVLLPRQPELSPQVLQQRLQTLQQWYKARENNIYVRRLQFQLAPTVQDTVDLQIKVAQVKNLFQ